MKREDIYYLIFFILTAIFSVLIYLEHKSWEHLRDPYHDVYRKGFDGEHIIGEEEIASVDPEELAERMYSEFDNLLMSNISEGWHREKTDATDNSLVVMSKKIDGPLLHSRIPIQRASWIISDCVSPKPLFDFLSSSEAYDALDPVMIFSSFYSGFHGIVNPPLASFLTSPGKGIWIDGGKLELRHSTFSLIWPFAKRYKQN